MIIIIVIRELTDKTVLRRNHFKFLERCNYISVSTVLMLCSPYLKDPIVFRGTLNGLYRKKEGKENGMCE